MKLAELLNNQQIKTAGQAKPDEANDGTVDPSLEPKKRQLETLQKQYDNIQKSLTQIAKTGADSTVLQRRAADLKEKMNKLKATMLDALELKQ